jgi:hypothetical protein
MAVGPNATDVSLVRPPNEALAKLQAGSHAKGDAARQLPRQTITRREQTATDVTPSHTLAQELQLRASVSPVCQLQLIVRRPVK